jgi:ubiquinone/menaquinone biosynthesis C-methylase UbiE
MGEPARAKKIVGAIYSAAADKLYEPLVVHGSFPLLAGKMPELVRAQGQRAVQVAAGEPILDVPIGTAYYTLPTSFTHPGIVVGVDYAWGMVARSAETARGAEVANIDLVQGDIHHLPFPDDRFGAILCTNGLQVIPGLQPALAELARVLAPGRTLFISVITLPASAILPRRGGRPTWLRSGRDIADEVERTGLKVISFQRERFATLIEASKAEPAIIRNPTL